jgi:hypothetical protein
MFRLGRDKLRKRATSIGVDRSQAACFFEAFDLVKEIGQTCDRSATVRPACRTLNRRMVTAAEPVYATCSFSDWPADEARGDHPNRDRSERYRALAHGRASKGDHGRTDRILVRRRVCVQHAESGCGTGPYPGRFAACRIGRPQRASADEAEETPVAGSGGCVICVVPAAGGSGVLRPADA